MSDSRLRHGKTPVLVFIQSGLRILPELEDHVDRVAGHSPLLSGLGIEPEDLEVAREPTRAHTPVEPSAAHVVQLGDAAGNDEWVVVGHAGDAGTQDDLLGLGDGAGQQQVGSGDVLPDAGEVLAEPGLVKPQLVQGDDLLQVAFQGLGEVRPRRMEGHGEESQFHGRCSFCRPILESRRFRRHLQSASSETGGLRSKKSFPAVPARICCLSEEERKSAWSRITATASSKV